MKSKTTPSLPESNGRVIDQIISGGLLCLIFFLPLFFSRFFDLVSVTVPSFYTNIVFNVPKQVLFAVAVDLLFILFCLKFLLGKKKITITLPPRWMGWALGGVFVSYLLATIFSEVPVLSFFGQYERGQGLLTVLHYLLFLFLVLSSFTREHIPRILWSITLGALLVAGYGLLQTVGYDPITLWSDAALRGRIFATLGHPNYLGYYFLFTIPATGYLWFYCSPKVFAKTVVGVSLLLQITAFFLSGSRAALLGLIGGSLTTLFIYVFQNSARFLSPKRVKKVIFGTGLLVIVGIALFSQPSFTTLLRFDQENLRSVEARIVIWQDTLRMIVERPLLGYGPDTFGLYFPHVKSAALLDLENYNLNADRAHNIVLDMLQSVGLAGISFFLWLLILCWMAAGKLMRKPGQGSLGPVFLTIFTAYFLANLWGFPVLVHDVYFWLFVGLLIVVVGQPKEFSLSRPRSLALCFPMLVFLAVSLVFHINLYRADALFFQASSLSDTDLLEQTHRLNPFSPVYAHVLAAKAATYPQELLEKLERMTAGRDYQTELLQTAWLVRQGNPEQARLEYQALAEKFPAVPGVYFSWAQMEQQTGNFTVCTEVYEKLIAISPHYWQTDETILQQPPGYRERARLFFKENPDFRTVFEQVSWCGLQIRDFQRVLKYAPHMTDSLSKYQWLYQAALESNQPELARQYLETCLKFGDNDACKDTTSGINR